MKINTFQNMGDGDRVIRVLIGALLIGYAMGVHIQTLGWFSILPLLAIPLIMTAILSWDPLYGLMNISTAKSIPVKTLGFMATNIGIADKYVRYAGGIVLLLATLVFTPTPIGWFALVPLAAAVLIMSSMIGWDPLYSILKLNTLEQKENLPLAVVIQADFSSDKKTDSSVVKNEISEKEKVLPKKVA